MVKRFHSKSRISILSRQGTEIRLGLDEQGYWKTSPIGRVETPIVLISCRANYI